MRGAKAWLGGCTAQELRNSAGEGILWPHCCGIHEDWDIVPVANPGAPPAPPTGPPQEDAAGVNAAAGTNASSSGTPSGGDQSSVMGSSGGVPIVKTQGMVS